MTRAYPAPGGDAARRRVVSVPWTPFRPSRRRGASRPYARARGPFQYAILRVVPRVERGGCVNIGAVLLARSRDFLAMRVTLDADRLRTQLDGLMRIAAGDPTAGPIARLAFTQRFHQLVAPSSTTLRASAVHTGQCDDPLEMLEHLHARLVLSGTRAADPARRSRPSVR